MGSCNSKGCTDLSTEIREIIDQHGRDKHNLLPILHDLQRTLGHISPEVMEIVAEELNVPASEVYGVTTFYTLFYTKPQGKYIIRLCDSPPCHIEGSKKVREALMRELGIEPGNTTEDGMFSLEIVSCMGLCGVAPAMMVNDDVYGNLTPEMIPDILSKYREAE
jgi:NADH-quinone oxidoreductase E subunit